MNRESLHLSEQELEQYLHEQLTDLTRLHHVDQCRHCRQQLAAYRAIDRFMQSTSDVESFDQLNHWSAEVMKQVEQWDAHRERVAERRLLLVSLVGLVVGIIGLGYLGAFFGWDAVFQSVSHSLVAIFGASTALSVLFYGIDRLERRLRLDPLQLILRITASS